MVSGVRRAAWACQPLADSRLVTLDDGYRLELSERVDVDVLELLWVESWRARLRGEIATALRVEAAAALVTDRSSHARRAAQRASRLVPRARRLPASVAYREHRQQCSGCRLR